MVYEPCEKDFQVQFRIDFPFCFANFAPVWLRLLLARPFYSSHLFQQISFEEIIEKMKETVLLIDMLTASPDFETLTEPTEYEVINWLRVVYAQ